MMKLRFLTVLLGLGMLLSAPAFALDLHAARAAGLIGETSGGYVAVIKATPETEALAANVNARRRNEYARISAENKQPVDVVARLAAQQIIAGLEPGALYQDADGAWKRR